MKSPYIYGEKEHFSILGWQCTKKALETMWVHGFWDRFTYKEMVSPHSKLNREGQKICKAYEKVLGRPVYYYIYYFCEPGGKESTIVPKGLPHQLPTVCPKCGGEWIKDTEFCKCEKCRLIIDSPEWGENK